MSEEKKALFGTIQRFNPRKGWGWIDSEEGKAIFVHESACNGYIPRARDKVSFRIVPGKKKGQFQAADVELLEEFENPDLPVVIHQDAIGQVKWFNDSLAYGFIKYEDDDKVFLHAANVKMPDNPRSGDWLRFDLAKNKRGPIALSARLTSPPEAKINTGRIRFLGNWGFIDVDGQDEDIYFDLDSLDEKYLSPFVDDRVSFTIVENHRGMRAENVRLIED